MITNTSNNFNYAGLLSTGGGGSTTVTIDPDIEFHCEEYTFGAGFVEPNQGLGNTFSKSRHGGGLLHVSLRTNQPEGTVYIPSPVQITIWSSNVHNPSVINKNYYPTHQKLEFDPQEVWTRSVYNTVNQSNMIATSLRITHKHYFFTVDSNGFVDPDWTIWICHSIHRSV
jgi:hypothetical protein